MRAIADTAPAEVALRGVGSVPVLRAADGSARSIDGRTAVLIPITDSGNALEVVHAEGLGGYLLLFHQIGSTTLFGRFDAVPSDRQIAEMIAAADHPALRTRAVVQLRPNGNTDIQVVAPPASPAAAPTT